MKKLDYMALPTIIYSFFYYLGTPQLRMSVQHGFYPYLGRNIGV